MQNINLFLDPVLIAPYRALDDPVWAWWLGTLTLALWCVLLGEATMALGRRINRRFLERSAGEARDMERKSLQALASGDKDSYKALNKLANEAFGQTFFQRAALGAASLWPAFLAAGWLQARFAGLEVPLPLLDRGVGYMTGFLPCYVLVRLGFGRLRDRLPFFRQGQAPVRGGSPGDGPGTATGPR